MAISDTSQQVANPFLAEVSAAQATLEQVEHSISTLQDFRGEVASSLSNFVSANSGKKNILSNLEPWKWKAACAQRAYDGLDGTLDGIGSKVIGLTYSTLLGLIDLKLAEYSVQKGVAWAALTAAQGKAAVFEQAEEAIEDILNGI